MHLAYGTICLYVQNRMDLHVALKLSRKKINWRKCYKTWMSTNVCILFHRLTIQGSCTHIGRFPLCCNKWLPRDMGKHHSHTRRYLKHWINDCDIHQPDDQTTPKCKISFGVSHKKRPNRRYLSIVPALVCVRIGGSYYSRINWNKNW